MDSDVGKYICRHIVDNAGNSLKQVLTLGHLIVRTMFCSLHKQFFAFEDGYDHGSM